MNIAQPGITSSPAQSQEPRDACAPFNDPDADTILRTSDHVNFRVHKLILSFASPVLKDMVKTRQSDSTGPCSPQIFDVPENARTIEYIMRCCYPLPSPSMTALEDLRSVLYAAHKYKIAAVTSLARVSLEQCLWLDVVGVFCIASRCELEDVCAKAAKESLRYKLTSLNSMHLDQISARQLYKLLRYHRHHATNTSASTSFLVWCSKDSRLSTSTAVSQGAISTAAAPFCRGTGDVILRSSNPQTDFHVHKAILSFASPVFRDMFQLGQPTPTLEPPAHGVADSIPIIDVTEDRRTLASMLHCIYPMGSSKFKGADHVQLFLEAGRKYDINIVSTLGKAELIKLIDRDVLGAFAIALRYNLFDVCTTAAKASLKYSLMALDSAELDHIPAPQYHSLLRYHDACRTAALEVVNSRTWFGNHILDVTDAPGRPCRFCQLKDDSGKSGSNEHTIGHPSRSSYINPSPSWHAPSQVWEYLKHAGQVLQERPHHASVLSDEVLSKWTPPLLVCSRPDGCRRTYIRDLFSRALAGEVEKTVAKVQIPSFA